jgi:hypothetical protein
MFLTMQSLIENEDKFYQRSVCHVHAQRSPGRGVPVAALLPATRASVDVVAALAHRWPPIGRSSLGVQEKKNLQGHIAMTPPHSSI